MTSEDASPTAVKRRRLLDHDGSAFASTATDDNAQQIVNFLTCPETSRGYIDEYFELWNSSQGACFPLPFSVDYNKSNQQSERCLYDYFCELKEPSLVINGYHRNTEGKVVGVDVGVEQNDNGKIEDIDLLLVDRDYGLFLFEVKDMREVVKYISNQEELNQHFNDMGVKNEPKKNNPRCPIAMIDYAVKQLYIRRQQVKDYLQHFFRDTETKKQWTTLWKMKDESCIHEMLEQIGNQEVERSIICLFGWNQYDENGNAKFDCHQDNCNCENKGLLIISTCHVVTFTSIEELKEENFKTWWKDYLKKNFSTDTMENKNLEEKLPAFEFLLNRFGLDFYRSEYIRKSVDVYIADENIRGETNRVKVEIHTSMPEQLVIKEQGAKCTPEELRLRMREEREHIADSLGLKKEQHKKDLEKKAEEKPNRKNEPEEKQETTTNKSKEKKRKRKKKLKEKNKTPKTNPMSKTECEQVAILWDRMQKRILLEAQLAFINGPPGSGKTILMIERVRKLVNNGVEKVLIIAGNNEGLEAMLKCELAEVKDKAFVTTDLGFVQWCKKQTDYNAKRFQHIFIDEAHELPMERLVDILENNMVSEKVENRHFWILRDGCQNRRWTAIRMFELNRHSSVWHEQDNLFTTYSLKYIFRLTQRQFRLIQPLTEYIYCDKCMEYTLKNVKKENRRNIRCTGEAFDLRHVTVKKVVCDCQPWHGIVSAGPEPLKLFWLTKDNPWPDNIAELVLKAFVLSWSNNLTLKKLTNEQFYDKLKTMFRYGLFEKTTILTDYAERLIDDLKDYINNVANICHLDKFRIVTAKQFYEQIAAGRKFCLTVETWKNFQGLESSVVIMLNPFRQWQNNEGTTFNEGNRNEFLISLSRANCRSILVTFKDDKNFVERALKIRTEFNVHRFKSMIPIGRRKTFFELLEEHGKTIHNIQSPHGEIADDIRSKKDLIQLYRFG